MSELKDLRQSIASLEELLALIASISERDDEKRKLDLVQSRRLLALKIGEIATVGNRLFTAFPDKELEAGFRSRLNAMRHAVAMHQADFPAVSLENKNAEFVASARRVRNSNREFVDWVKPMLVGLNDKITLAQRSD
jgi:hypothetical protein